VTTGNGSEAPDCHRLAESLARAPSARYNESPLGRPGPVLPDEGVPLPSSTAHSMVTHAEGRVTDAQLAALEALAFGTYDGVIASDCRFIPWYRARPGMDAACCQAALSADGTVVASVFVTSISMAVGGEVLPAAAIDTVMTHPDHRGLGLASALMERAHQAVRSRGADLMVLYTAAGSAPQRLYERLGYKVCATFAYWCGSVTRPSAAKPAVSSGGEVLAARPEGFRPYTDADREWFRAGPAPRRWFVAPAPSGGRPLSVCYASAPVRLAGTVRPASVACDATSFDDSAELRRLLSLSPDPGVLWLLDGADGHRSRLLAGASLRVAAREVEMVLPLTEAGSQALARSEGPWYPIMESIIGV